MCRVNSTKNKDARLVKKTRIDYRKRITIQDKNDRLDVKIDYQIYVTRLNQCPRCLLYNCKEKEKVCVTCDDTLKYLKI